MPLELRRKPDGTLKSKWWYGAYMVNARRYATNLGVKVKGTPPESLRVEGDATFERSRGEAQAKLDQVIADARGQKTAESLVQNLHEIKYGSKILSFPIADLQDAWDKMPKKRSTLQKRYVKDVHATIRRFVEFVQEKHPDIIEAAQVTRDVAIGFMDSERKRKMAAKTWNDSLKRMRSIFKFLQIEYGVLRNPFDGISSHKEDHIHRKPFSMEEIETLLKAVEDDDFCRPIIVCGLSTAMRRGDCCLLKWADVDMNGPQPSITVKTSKTGQTVCIPIYDRLMGELARAQRLWDGESEYVWPEMAKMQLENEQGVSWRLKKAFVAAGFKDDDMHAKRADGYRRCSVKDFHSFRTTWITEALSRGVPIETVKLISGHKTVEVVTTHYFHPNQEHVRNALNGALPVAITGNEPLPSAGEGPKLLTGKPAKMKPMDRMVALAVKIAEGTATEKEKERFRKLAAKV